MEKVIKLKEWMRSAAGQKLVSLGLSIVGVIGLCLMCGISDVERFPFNTFLFLPLTLLLYVAYVKSPMVKRGALILSLVMTVILSTILVIGRQVDTLSGVVWSWKTVVTILGMSALIYVVMKYVVNFCKTYFMEGNFELTRKQKIVIFVVILACNFLILLAAFPGIYGWDASYQAYRFLNNIVTSHYSVLMTGVFGGLLGIGRDVFGSIEVGMIIAMVLQVVFISYVYARVVYFVSDYVKNKWVVLGAIAFFTLNLIMGMATVYATQDIVFGGVFALLFMELFRLAHDTKYWSSKLNVAKFIILAFLLCATRNNGMYVLCLVFLTGALVSAKRKRDLPILAVPIILSLLYTGPFFDFLGIPNKDSVREMMSVPSQQLARVYTLRPEALSFEEKEKIEGYYKVEGLLRYRQLPAKADPTKGSLDGKKVEGNWGDYIYLWLKIGAKNPKTYIEAFLLNSLGFWYPSKDYNDPRADIPYIDYWPSRLWSEGDGSEYAEMKIEQHSLLPGYEWVLGNLFALNGWRCVPVLANLTSMGTYFLLFVLLCGMTIYQKRKKFILPLSLVLGNYLILLLAPVAVFRYCYPIIIVAPIMFVMLFQNSQQSKSAPVKALSSGIMKISKGKLTKKAKRSNK